MSMTRPMTSRASPILLTTFIAPVLILLTVLKVFVTPFIELMGSVNSLETLLTLVHSYAAFATFTMVARAEMAANPLSMMPSTRSGISSSSGK